MASPTYERVILMDGDQTVQLIVEKSEAAKIRNDSSVAAQYLQMRSSTIEIAAAEDDFVQNEAKEACSSEEITTELMQIQESSSDANATNENEEHYLAKCVAEDHACRPCGEKLVEDKKTWTHSMAMQLAEVFKTREHLFRDPKRKRKDLWREVAAEMHGSGFKVTGEMCDKKWRNLKQTYKAIKRSNQGMRSGRRTWEFFGMFEEIYGKDPEFQNDVPLQESDHATVFSAATPPPLESSSKRPRRSSSMSSLSSFSESSFLSEAHVPSKRSRLDSRPPEWFRIFMRRYQEDEERKMDLLRRMHHETVKLEKRKCEAMERLLELLKHQKS